MMTRRAVLAALGAPLAGCVHRPPIVTPPSPPPPVEPPPAPVPCVWGTPQWHPDPVLEPTEPWEGRCAMPFSDGCWWDADRQAFCLWYMAGYNGGTALAQSADGYAWRKLGLVDPTPRDSSTVWQVPDGYVRATYFMTAYAGAGLTLQRSFDGIAWRTVGQTPPLGDRSTVYRLADGRWVLSTRENPTAARYRGFLVADAFEGPYLRTGELFGGQLDDDVDALTTPQIYNLDARAFGAGYLGLASIWGGDYGTRPKRNTLRALTSRDGVSWNRGPAQWVTGADGTWRDGNIQTCGGLCVELRPGLLGFYVSARSGPVATQRCVTGLVTIARKDVCV